LVGGVRESSLCQANTTLRCWPFPVLVHALGTPFWRRVARPRPMGGCTYGLCMHKCRLDPSGLGPHGQKTYATIPHCIRTTKTHDGLLVSLMALQTCIKSDETHIACPIQTNVFECILMFVNKQRRCWLASIFPKQIYL
jgi:hypothetical protein